MSYVTASAAASWLAVSMAAGKPYFDITIIDAMQCMVPVLSDTEDDLLLASTVFGEFVGPGDGHLLGLGTRALPSDEVLFYSARQTGARAMLFGSRSSGYIGDLHDTDVDLARRLLEAGERNGIEVVEVLVARDHMFRFMSFCTDLWGRPAPEL